MADIKINLEVWNDTSEEERSEIRKILTASKLIKDDDDIVGDAGTEKVFETDAQFEAAEKTDISAESAEMTLSSVCQTGCKTVRDVARNACGLKYPFSSSKRRKCREQVERAYEGCLAACDLVDGI